jgi:hypothetical protein
MSRRIVPVLAAVPLVAALSTGCAGRLDPSGRSAAAAVTSTSTAPLSGQAVCAAIVRRFAASLALPLGLVHEPIALDDHLPAPVRADLDTVAAAYARATRQHSLEPLLGDRVWGAVRRIDAVARGCG